MTGPSEPDSVTYRLIITRRQAADVLFQTDRATWSLPSLEVPRGARPVRELTTGIRQGHDLATACLWSTSDPPCAYAVLEALREDGEAPAGMTWAAWRDIESRAALAWEDRAFVRGSLGDLNQQSGTFVKPGWIRELLDWTEGQLEPFGLRLTGGFVQWNASPTFSLVRIETTGAAAWFKAAGEPNTRELPIALALARLFPGYVPSIVGVHSRWNGWLSVEVAGTPLDQTKEFCRWRDAAVHLAELQISSIGQTSELLAAEVKNLDACYLHGQIEPFLSKMHALMAAQQKPAPRPLTEHELDALADGLKRSCELLVDSHFPNTLNHFDLNPGNILVSEGRSVFLDWAEACVAHPLLGFEYLREHMTRAGIAGPTTVEALTAAYLDPWSRLVSSAELSRDLRHTPLIAVFAYAVANDCWRSPELLHNTRLAGLFRSLARRMHREAIALPQGARCA